MHILSNNHEKCIMRSQLIFVVLLLLVTACVSDPEMTETQTLPENSIELSIPNPTIDEDLLTTAVPESIEDVEIPSYVEYSNGNLWLRLFTPMDGDIVTQEVIDVSGQAPAETVISLNDFIFLVTEEGSFSIPVILDEGSNVIELVASNMDGDEIALVLTIVYDKD